jgi:hypothetical protein
MESKSTQIETDTNQMSTTSEVEMKTPNISIATDTATKAVVNPLTIGRFIDTEVTDDYGVVHSVEAFVAAETSTKGVAIPIARDEIIEYKLTEASDGFLKTFILKSRFKNFDLDFYIELIRPTVVHRLTEEVDKQGGVKAFITMYPIYNEFKPEGRLIPRTLQSKMIVARNKVKVLRDVERAFAKLRNLHDAFQPYGSSINLEQLSTLKLDIAPYNPCVGII